MTGYGLVSRICGMALEESGPFSAPSLHKLLSTCSSGSLLVGSVVALFSKMELNVLQPEG